MHPFHTPAPARTFRSGARGFTLIELMIAVLVLGVMIVVLMSLMYGASRSKIATTNRLESTQAARVALDMMARDLRSAGYGVDLDATPPQPPIAYVDSTEIILAGDFPNNPGTPEAYDPGSTPKPQPLAGTAWEPPVKYGTSAELIRWTLDLNNDGNVDAADAASGAGVEASRTRNPNDFVLGRQIYGDVSGSNGGSIESVALVSAPGGSNPPMFQVYTKGATTPWDWSNGPVPEAMLSSIERIVVQVVAPSSRPDEDGAYPSTTLRTEVNSLRNVPNFGQPLYAVDGVVFNDNVSQNGSFDTGEPGLPGVLVRCGTTYTATTNSSGRFVFHVPAGSYTLRHLPPVGYGTSSDPDSFVVTVPPPPTSVAFADTARRGGWITVYAYDDTDEDGTFDTGEAMLPSVRFTMTPGDQVVYTDQYGRATLFAQEGGYSVVAIPPDSMATTTPNPVSGTMADGGTASLWFGFGDSETGTISGKVYLDANKDGNPQGGESGQSNVWVGVTKDGGFTILGYAYTDAAGAYSITVPINDPPATVPYSVYLILPAGFYPTSPAAITNQWVQANQNLNNRDFGIGSFQRIQLTAQRVLSLASGDLVEKDWNGNQTHNRDMDADLVLGADAAGTDQVSVWFNQYPGAPLFNTLRDYNRTAAQAVMCLSVDTLDSGTANLQDVRADVVTGTKYASTGNFYVWLTQNNPNEGFVPTIATRSYMTADLGDVQALLTGDMTGSSATPDQHDLLVGTKSPSAGFGTIELWQNSNGSAPTWSRVESHPAALSPYTLGEVNGMVRADFDNDGDLDLAVVGKTGLGAFTGQVVIYRYNGRTASPRFTFASELKLTADVPNCLSALDVNGDGYTDLVLGTQTGLASGRLIWLYNGDPLNLAFTPVQTVNTPGIVQTMTAADFGGISQLDVAIGWRASTTSYAGGCLIFYTDLGYIFPSGLDPTQGVVTDWTAAVTTNNFNFGNPSPPSTPLADLAVGVKSSATTGALWVLIR